MCLWSRNSIASDDWQAWQKYSQEVRASNPVKLDYLVVRRAFEEGWALKEIGQMLVAGSPYVRAMHWEKEKSIVYVKQTVKAYCQLEYRDNSGKLRWNYECDQLQNSATDHT